MQFGDKVIITGGVESDWKINGKPYYTTGVVQNKVTQAYEDKEVCVISKVQVHENGVEVFELQTSKGEIFVGFSEWELQCIPPDLIKKEEKKVYSQFDSLLKTHTIYFTLDDEKIYKLNPDLTKEVVIQIPSVNRVNPIMVIHKKQFDAAKNYLMDVSNLFGISIEQATFYKNIEFISDKEFKAYKKGIQERSIILSKTLDKIKKQIKEDIGQYEHLEIEDVEVFVEEDKICFSIGNYAHRETEEEFYIAYVNGIKVDIDTAIALNTASMLSQMDDIKRTM